MAGKTDFVKQQIPRPLRIITVETERGKISARMDMRAKVARFEFYDLRGNKIAELNIPEEEYLKTFRNILNQLIEWLEFWRKG